MHPSRLISSFFVLACFFAAEAFGFGSSPAATPSPSPVASSLSAPLEHAVWVARLDGGLSCQPETAQPLEKGAEELRQAGIQVLKMKKVPSGRLMIQMCGVPTGNRNAYLISGGDLESAKKRHFEELVK